MRLRLLPTAAALLLAACATAAPLVTSELHEGHDPADGSGAAGTPHPSVPPGADGSIEIVTEYALGGSGVTAAEAIEVASSQPVLMTGILLRDPDGGIWFCDRLAGSAPPSCGSPRLWVIGFPDDATVFDAADAASTGARTEGGVIWIPDQQLFGVAHPAP